MPTLADFDLLNDAERGQVWESIQAELGRRADTRRCVVELVRELEHKGCTVKQYGGDGAPHGRGQWWVRLPGEPAWFPKSREGS